MAEDYFLIKDKTRKIHKISRVFQGDSNYYYAHYLNPSNKPELLRISKQTYNRLKGSLKEWKRPQEKGDFGALYFDIYLGRLEIGEKIEFIPFEFYTVTVDGSPYYGQTFRFLSYGGIPHFNGKMLCVNEHNGQGYLFWEDEIMKEGAFRTMRDFNKGEQVYIMNFDSEGDFKGNTPAIVMESKEGEVLLEVFPNVLQWVESKKCISQADAITGIHNFF